MCTSPLLLQLKPNVRYIIFYLLLHEGRQKVHCFPCAPSTRNEYTTASNECATISTYGCLESLGFRFRVKGLSYHKMDICGMDLCVLFGEESSCFIIPL